MSQIITHKFSWRELNARVTEIRDHKIDGWTRLEIEVLQPKGAPLPFSGTTAHVHELDAEELAKAGGVTAFLTEWCERERSTKRYADADFRWRQGHLL